VSAQGLRDLLAVSIPDATAREAFVKPRNTGAGAPVQSGPHSASGPRTGISSAPSRLISMPVSRPRQDTSRPSGLSGPSSASASMNVQHFSAELQAQLERLLSLYIGPLAKTLVRKESARQATLSALAQALAQLVDKPDDRAKFLAAAQKLGR
jgi:hypothetical protein